MTVVTYLRCPECDRTFHSDLFARMHMESVHGWTGDVAADPADGAVLAAFALLVDIARKRAEEAQHGN